MTNNPLYVCNCGSHNGKIVDYRITEVDPVGFSDALGINHSHDDINCGHVVFECENGHKTKHEYIGSCDCGWNSRDKGGLYPEPHLSHSLFD